jgi:hypothetical protein
MSCVRLRHTTAHVGRRCSFWSTTSTAPEKEYKQKDTIIVIDGVGHQIVMDGVHSGALWYTLWYTLWCSTLVYSGVVYSGVL